MKFTSASFSPSIVLLLLVGMMALFAAAASAGEVLYKSDFAAVPDGKLPEGFTAYVGTWEVQGNRLIGHSASRVNGQIIFGDAKWTDYEIEAKITYLSSDEPTRWAALMYRGPERGVAPHYLFTIRQNAAAANGVELAYRNPTDTGWDVHVTKSFSSQFVIGRTYTIKAVVYGNNAVYYIDGQEILNGEGLVQQSSGTIGFVTNGVRIAVEDLVVRALDEADIAKLPRTAQGVVPTVGTGQGGTQVPLVIAHRGASGVYPENTILAFDKAREIGSDLLELDVHRTRDGHLVVIHDGTVDRTAKGAYTGRVADLTLEQIRTLDAGIWKSLQMRGERVPTLEETLLSVEGQAMFLVENKVTGLERQIADVIRATGMQRNIVFQSFDANSVKAFRAVMPDVPAAVLFNNPGINDEIQRAASLVETTLVANASAVSVNYTAVTPAFVRYIQARGLSVFAWTVDNESDMKRMIEAGVDGIITNYPERLNKLLGR